MHLGIRHVRQSSCIACRAPGSIACRGPVESRTDRVTHSLGSSRMPRSSSRLCSKRASSCLTFSMSFTVNFLLASISRRVFSRASRTSARWCPHSTNASRLNAISSPHVIVNRWMKKSRLLSIGWCGGSILARLVFNYTPAELEKRIKDGELVCVENEEEQATA